MNVRALFSVLFATLLCGGVATAQQSSTESASAPTLQEIVARIAKAQADNRERYRPYTVTREYKLFGDNSAQPDSRVIADVSFVPPVTKQYAILDRAGSGQGEKVVRKVLEHEQEVTADWGKTALTPDNYDFAFVGEEPVSGRRCYVLDLKPKRDSKDLIRGRAWIDSETFNIQRISGQPAKSPSWWVKKLDLTLTFAEVDGMWLQTGAKADADVRLFGKHVLTARDLDYRTSSVAASSQPGSPQRPARNYARTIGAGVILAH